MPFKRWNQTQSRMAADHICVPGLSRPVSLIEYAKLEGIREADVLVAIGQLKIPAAFFQGQWYVEPTAELRSALSQLRATDSEKTKTNKEIQRDWEAKGIRMQFLQSHWR